MATVAERIVTYLRERPVPICTDCLAMKLGLAQRQQANPIVEALGLTSDFKRYDGACSDCIGPPKKVICRA